MKVGAAIRRLVSAELNNTVKGREFLQLPPPPQWVPIGPSGRVLCSAGVRRGVWGTWGVSCPLRDSILKAKVPAPHLAFPFWFLFVVDS